MVRTRMAALIITAGLALAGCSDGDGSKPAAAESRPPVNCQDPNLSIVDRAACGPGSGMTTAPIIPTPTPTLPPICSEATVHPQVWFSVCGQTGPAPGEEPATPAGPMPLGEATTTGGSTTTGGTLETTPTTVVYSPRVNRDTDPSKDTFVVVTVKERNTGAVPTDPEGQWTYTAPDGEALTTGVILLSGGGFNSIGEQLQPGSFHWGYRAWAIRGDQRGGTLLYEDSTGVIYRWQLPAQDTGPQIADVKGALD